MGRQIGVVQLEQWIVWRNRFRIVGIETTSRNLVRRKRSGQRRLIDDRPARDIDQIGRFLHPLERRIVDQVSRLVGEQTE